MKTKITLTVCFLVISSFLPASFSPGINAQDDIYYTPSKKSASANTTSPSKGTVVDTSGMSDYEKYRAMRDGGNTKSSGGSQQANSKSMDQYTVRGSQNDSIAPDNSVQPSAQQGTGTTIVNNYYDDGDYASGYNDRFSRNRSMYFDYYYDPFFYGYDPFFYGGYWGYGGFGWGLGLGWYSPCCYWGYSPYYYPGYYHPYYYGYGGGGYYNSYYSNRGVAHPTGSGRRPVGTVNGGGVGTRNYAAMSGRRTPSNPVVYNSASSRRIPEARAMRTTTSSPGNNLVMNSNRRNTAVVPERFANVQTTRPNTGASNGNRTYTPSYNVQRSGTRPTYNTPSSGYSGNNTNYSAPRRSSEPVSAPRQSSGSSMRSGGSAPSGGSSGSSGGGGRSSGGSSSGGHSSGGGGGHRR